jgi:hypothetical protein
MSWTYPKYFTPRTGDCLVVANRIVARDQDQEEEEEEEDEDDDEEEKTKKMMIMTRWLLGAEVMSRDAYLCQADRGFFSQS